MLHVGGYEAVQSIYNILLSLRCRSHLLWSRTFLATSTSDWNCCHCFLEPETHIHVVININQLDNSRTVGRRLGAHRLGTHCCKQKPNACLSPHLLDLLHLQPAYKCPRKSARKGPRHNFQTSWPFSNILDTFKVEKHDYHQNMRHSMS